MEDINDATYMVYGIEYLSESTPSSSSRPTELTDPAELARFMTEEIGSTPDMLLLILQNGAGHVNTFLKYIDYEEIEEIEE